MQKKDERKRLCVVCGTPLQGRADKVFCSVECKNAFFNEQKSQVNGYRKRVLTSLNGNYRILNSLLVERVNSISLCDIEMLGFRPSMVTGYNKTTGKVAEFRCFDIGYCQNEKRIYKIARVKKH